ncbi:MAG: hypothetical protein ACE5Q3_02715 [Alphaproteobacteria bacterium]
MCGLCGVLGPDQHWSDPASRPSVFARRRSPPTRRQERLGRVALANQVLAAYGLKLADWQGRSYVLRNSTGETEMVDHLGALWSAAERLAKRPCDPLDPALVEHLERR